MSTTVDRRPDVGLIGFGIMGRGLAHNLVGKGYALRVLDTNPAALTEAAGMGAGIAKSPAELATTCAVIITCLPSLASITSIYLGDQGLLAAAAPGTVFVDCSTSEPGLTRDIAERAAGRGCALLDAPMFKTPKAAFDGTLHLVVGGAASVLETCRPVLETFSERIIHAGPSGAGHTVKLINNAVTVCNAAIVCEALTVARKLGVDFDILCGVMSVSMAASSSLPIVSRRLIDNDHAPSFSTDVVKKDITLFTQLATSVGAMTMLADSARELIRLASADGYGDDHYTRIATVMEKVAGISR